MRAPFNGPADVRRTERYLSGLSELATYAELHRFEGGGSFYAWERLNGLVERLRQLYDGFELEGDAAPVRAAIEAYQADFWRLHVKPDPWVSVHLSQFLAALEEPAEAWLTVRTRVVPPLPEVQWPETYLAVHPHELDELLRRKGSPSPLPPGA